MNTDSSLSGARQAGGAQRGGRRAHHLALAVCLAGGLAAGGCRQDMHDQPKYKAQARSDFFIDQRAGRPLVEGTVPRGFERADTLLYTGKVEGKPAEVFPFAVTAPVMARGRERFDIFCSPCHGRTGAGDGLVVRRGFRQPTSFHDERLWAMAPGYVFDVITNGFGAMPDYTQQVPVEDRWAIAAYIRALQRSHRGTLADVPGAERTRLEAEAGR